MVSSSSPAIRRPIRVAALLAGGLMLYSSSLYPFLEGINLAGFAIFVLVYSSFQAWFAIGIGLALQGRWLWWWLLSGVVPLIGMVVWGFLLRQLETKEDLDLFFSVNLGLLYVLVLWGAAGCVVAGSGWVGYLRCRGSSGPA